MSENKPITVVDHDKTREVLRKAFEYIDGKQTQRFKMGWLELEHHASSYSLSMARLQDEGIIEKVSKTGGKYTYRFCKDRSEVLDE